MENAIIKAIPEGAAVTVYTIHGREFSGTDDTSREEESAGLFVLYAEPEQRGGLNTRHVMRACDVIGFTLRYQTAD
jgi:hypothetical protein